MITEGGGIIITLQEKIVLVKILVVEIMITEGEGIIIIFQKKKCSSENTSFRDYDYRRSSNNYNFTKKKMF